MFRGVVGMGTGGTIVSKGFACCSWWGNIVSAFEDMVGEFAIDAGKDL